ncbi:MAG: [protein-PII] uridylyltransferase, partial [Actinomycetota bacterium]|nr:[protein-PII] uridylyltransferase [Actinomycetota bacterium]
LLARPDLDGAGRRAALTAWYDEWLAGLAPHLPEMAGVALVAVGGLARSDPSPYGDIDLLLLHSGQKFIGELAESIWYPVWDSGVSLDHSVRTMHEALTVGARDLKAGVGLLDARHIAGDPHLTSELLKSARAAWRSKAAGRLAELRESCRARGAANGEVAHLLEPDLKEGRGGLRDVGVLRAIATAQVVDVHWRDVQAAHVNLLDARDALHLVTGRPQERLQLQEQDGVAKLLGLADADVLVHAVASSARRVAFALDTAWRAVERWSNSRRHGWSPRKPLVVRRPLADGVVEQDGEVLLAREADPTADPVLGLRVAAAAARADVPIGPYALERLQAELAPMPEPWTEEARNTLVTLLGSGPSLVGVWEALDQHDLLGRMLPEWEGVRSRPQRNAVHTYTVDRHLVATAVEASAFTRQVGRPDLLLLGALFHDIGKGMAGDHIANGERMMARIAPRLGLAPADAETLLAMVRHHLLLPDTATRRDLDDPATIDSVVAAVGGSFELLDLLQALTEADAAATGPAAWSDWKAGLIADLVARARALAGGHELPLPTPADPALLVRARGGETVVEVGPAVVVVSAAGVPGLLSRAAGVLTLHRLDVLAASATTVEDTTYIRFDVRPRFGSVPDPTRVRADVRRAMDGTLPLEERLAEREHAYSPQAPPAATVPAPRVLWFDEAATDAVVLELRAADSLGLLHRVTGALERCGAEVRSALVATLGGDVVDAFYLGGDIDRDKVEREVIAAAEH